MQIEVALLISVLSVGFSILFGLKNTKRTDVKDIEARAKESANINAKLDVVINNVSEIKDEVRRDRMDIVTLDQRLTRIEEAHKSILLQIDKLEGEK